MIDNVRLFCRGGCSHPPGTAPSVRELSAKLTEGESFTRFEISDMGTALSPTLLRGTAPQPGPSVALTRHLPTPWGVTLAEGAFYIATKISPGFSYAFLPTPKSAKMSVRVSSASEATRRMRSGVM